MFGDEGCLNASFSRTLLDRRMRLGRNGPPAGYSQVPEPNGNPLQRNLLAVECRQLEMHQVPNSADAFDLDQHSIFA